MFEYLFEHKFKQFKMGCDNVYTLKIKRTLGSWVGLSRSKGQTLKKLRKQTLD